MGSIVNVTIGTHVYLPDTTELLMIHSLFWELEIPVL